MHAYYFARIDFNLDLEFCAKASFFLLLILLAFRYYDKDKVGSISTDTLKEILRELDNKLTDDDLNGIIEEVDGDRSGTLDFDEFMAMMTG